MRVNPGSGRGSSSQGRQALTSNLSGAGASCRSEKSGHFAVDMRHACTLETFDANGRREGNWTGTALPGASHQVDLSHLMMHTGYICDRFGYRQGMLNMRYNILLTVCWTAGGSNHVPCLQGGTAGDVRELVVNIRPYP
jgi:hypothetical protein